MRTWVKILFALVVLGIIGAYLGYKFIYNKPHPDYEIEKAEVLIKAADLYNDFKTSTKESETKYNGKMIEVDGTLGAVEQSDSLVTMVFILNQGMFGGEGIRCTMLPNHREEAEKYSAGSAVKIKGLCQGFNDTDVVLEKCMIAIEE